jgi:hypothetical protein
MGTIAGGGEIETEFLIDKGGKRIFSALIGACAS